MKIIHVVGARPNFMKMAPVYNALKAYPVKQLIVHTGQHYSANMSDVFFKEFKIPEPDINLHVGGGTSGEAVIGVMRAIEPYLAKTKPDLVMIYGDINSSLAAALSAAKLGFKVAHVEAGLRSFDSTLPEEVNRILVDRVSSIFFTPSRDGNANLVAEGHDKKHIHFVGNVMIDTLKAFLPAIKKQAVTVPLEGYGVLTLHRPHNVDNPKQLKKILTELNAVAKKIPLLFPVHPRTKKNIAAIKGFVLSKNIMLADPLGYVEFISLVHGSRFVITDSGGIQEETTYLKLPCLTLRPNTERPITITKGSNTLIGNDFTLLKKKINAIVKGTYKKGSIPEKWDGKAGERIAKIILKDYAKK